MKIITELFKTRFNFFNARFFSHGHKKIGSEIAEKYPNVISPKELRKMLETCSTSQKYKYYQETIQGGKTMLEKYPNKVNSEKLSQALKEAEATRKKFSIY